MTVLKTTGFNPTPFKAQAFFKDFNWQVFEPGDIIHLVDYLASDCSHRQVGIFQGIDSQGHPVIRLIPRSYEIILLRTNVENIRSLADQGFWGQFINS